MTLASALLIAAALVAATFRRGVRSSPIAYYSLYCFFFLFGPVLNAVLGQPIYRGTVLTEIGTVAYWYVAALAGLLLADIVMPAHKVRPFAEVSQPSMWIPVKTFLALGGLYGYVTGLTIGATALTKHAGLAAAGPLHYRYLLVEAIIAAGFWFFRDNRTVFKWYAFNVGGYLVYCLAFDERDFVFVAYAIAVTGVLLGRLTVRWALATSMAGLYVATELFLARMSQSFSLASLLNQGSNLFVDTFLSSSHRTVLEPLRHTYGRVVTGRLPMEGSGTAEWFKGIYAPLSPSGYGFSLIGEARYNWGTLGPLFLFFLLGVALVLSFRQTRLWDPRLAGPPLLYALMYALRGDLRAVAVSLVFIALVHMILRLPIGQESPQRRPAYSPDKLGGGPQ